METQEEQQPTTEETTIDVQGFSENEEDAPMTVTQAASLLEEERDNILQRSSTPAPSEDDMGPPSEDEDALGVEWPSGPRASH